MADAADPTEPPEPPTGLEPAFPQDTPGPRVGRQLEPALGGFFEALLDARQSRAQVQRVQALIRLGQQGDSRAMPALLMALSDPDWIIRKYAASGLGRITAPEGPRALDALVSLLPDARPEVRRAAARAIGRLDDGRRLAQWLQAVTDTDWLVREAAIEGLGRHPDDAATAALLTALSDRVWLNRYEALKALGARPADRVLPGLLAALRTDQALAPWLAPAIARFGLVALPGLLELLEPAPPWRQLAIADALGRLDDDRARAALAGMVGHPDAEIEAAIQHHGGAMRDYLLRALGEPDWMVRWHAAKLLGRLADPAAAVALRPLLDDARPEVRLASLSALKAIADPLAETDLVRCLTDASWHIRQGAVEALGALTTAGARRALVDALGDSRSEVRLSARQALLAQGPAAEPVLSEALLRRPASYDEIAWLLKALKRPAAGT